MGQSLNYDLGRLNIGRIVKVFGDSSKHGAPAKLVGATPKHAVVRIANADRDQERAWADVRDWTSHNAQPLTTTAPPPPHANGKPASAPARPPEPPKATPTATLVPTTTTPPASPFAVYADLSARLDAAVANVAAAEEMVDQALEQLHQAKRDHQDAVEGLRALRAKAAAALTAIDSHLVGTTAAPTN